jgi:hypothetical protein
MVQQRIASEKNLHQKKICIRQNKICLSTKFATFLFKRSGDAHCFSYFSTVSGTMDELRVSADSLSYKGSYVSSNVLLLLYFCHQNRFVMVYIMVMGVLVIVELPV